MPGMPSRILLASCLAAGPAAVPTASEASAVEPFVATSVNGAEVIMPRTGIGLFCTSSEVRGTGLNLRLTRAVASGSASSQSNAGSIESFSATGCSTPVGVINIQMEGTWGVDAVQFDPEQPGFIDAVLTDVVVRFTGAGCTGKATGGLPIAYSRRNAFITAKPEVPNPASAKITISEISDACWGFLELNEEVTWTADYNVVWNPAS
ncbi:hypothetical protein ACIHCQ_33330 [Streptomyces sp. NPDC052236]|uniref:hypothetical protein n=1 Tax=Streptomyces sp. NPDC052236 TaxID=3365686 RepID=UPI0037D8D7AB